ncbi:hypothetical protein ZHAS_00015256 [Anopheles sinensis]|uniref:Uncharacterized protein n=1 Tax=Anopheles sinensis TaxID=74873 RepID=A0A084WAF2_ANOSI|nr:hypothetical protein ZHAS_00015256 [Anopheles sinensis]
MKRKENFLPPELRIDRRTNQRSLGGLERRQDIGGLRPGPKNRFHRGACSGPPSGSFSGAKSFTTSGIDG